MWDLSGYIPGNAAFEVTNLYTPFVALNCALIKNAFKKGYILIFKDIDASIYKQVVIKSLTIKPQADCRNKTPFSMTIKEINVMDSLSSLISESAKAALPQAGSILGNQIALGSAISKMVIDPLAAASVF